MRKIEIPTEDDHISGSESIYWAFHRERIRAHELHGPKGGSMEVCEFDHPQFLSVVTEELGEVARAVNENYLGTIPGWDEYKKVLRKELIQPGAMTAAWVDAIDMDEAR